MKKKISALFLWQQLNDNSFPEKHFWEWAFLIYQFIQFKYLVYWANYPKIHVWMMIPGFKT